jgi:aconitate hydratase
MGVLPLVFKPGEDRKTLGITGQETIDILGLENLKARMMLDVVIHRPDGTETRTQVQCRVDTADEVEYYKQGGILHYVLRSMAGVKVAA